jgi:hypothetical protein
MTIEIHASSIKSSMRSAEILRHVLKNPSQVQTLANLLDEFVKSKGVLTKKQVFMIFVSCNYSYYFLRTDFVKALVRLRDIWMSLKSATMSDLDSMVSS